MVSAKVESTKLESLYLARLEVWNNRHMQYKGGEKIVGLQ